MAVGNSNSSGSGSGSGRLLIDWENVLRMDLQSKDADRIRRKLELLGRVSAVELVGKFHLGGTKDDHDQKSHAPGGLGSRYPRDGEVSGVGPEGINGISQIGNVPLNEWLLNHGIDRATFEARGYSHYNRTGEEGMDDAINEAYGNSQAAMAQMRNASSQASGVIMTRHAVEGSPIESENPILPQTRPDEKIISATSMTNLRRIMRDEGVVSANATDSEMFDALDRDPELKDKVLNGFTNEAGEKVPGFGAKYLFPAEENNAGRVDLNPGEDGENARRFLEGDGRVYLAMEGSLKTDAVISAVRREGQADASVIGVPSVTLWNHKELQWVADNHLQGREVVLIPDSDGVTNPAVINQARALQARLQQAGAGRVVVAAPPLGENESIQEVGLPGGGREKLKGVDDFLGAGRGSLDGLSYVDRTAPRPDFSLTGRTCNQRHCLYSVFHGSYTV